MAARLIHTVLPVVSPPRPTIDVLGDIIRSQGWFVGADADDKAEEWLPRFIQRLEFIVAENVGEGRYLSFAFNSSGTAHLQGYCFCEPGDTEEIKSSKRKRANTISIFEHFKTIDDRQFEFLCGKVLGLLNVETPFVSKASADHGIDFFGRVKFGDMLKASLLHQGAEKNLHMWLVGQAKHYPESKVSTKEIRELVGSVELARANVFAGTSDPLRDLTAKLCDPIIYLFFTTGRFTRDSKELMSKAGVVSFTGLQIAQFLADRSIGLVVDNFDVGSFNAWLDA
jgi:hypothetical protein